MTSKIQWPFPHRVGALQTTRCMGDGRPLDMSPTANSAAHIQELVQTQHLPHSPMMLKQVHGADVIELKQQPTQQYYAQADACWSRQVGVICTILTADCLPILVADKKATVVAAIHCGWRSLAAGIIPRVFQQLNCDPVDLLVWLGPCISAAVYQVGPELVQQFSSTPEQPDFNQCFTPDSNAKGKFLADLQQIAKLNWQQLGVTQIDTSPDCTIRNNDRYYSWRAEKTSARMASMIWLKP